MGCRPSSSFKKKESNIPTKIKTSRTSIRETANHLERILDGHGEHLVGRFELDSADLLFDLSANHILLLDHQHLRLIHIQTKTTETILLPFNIQDIVWSTKLNAFLLLGLDRIYQTKTDRLQLNVIDQIQVKFPFDDDDDESDGSSFQFTNEGFRRSYMTADGDDLLINRSFGLDLRHYSLNHFRLIRSFRVYKENVHVCVTTIGLNSKKIVAVAVSLNEKQFVDFLHLHTQQFLRRIALDSSEHLFYPINMHLHGQWFAKTSIPYVNIGHCLLSADGQMIRLKLFSDQDNFIRSLKVNENRKWLAIGRQHALELYSFIS